MIAYTLSQITQMINNVLGNALGENLLITTRGGIIEFLSRKLIFDLPVNSLFKIKFTTQILYSQKEIITPVGILKLDKIYIVDPADSINTKFVINAQYPVDNLIIGELSQNSDNSSPQLVSTIKMNDNFIQVVDDSYRTSNIILEGYLGLVSFDPDVTQDAEIENIFNTYVNLQQIIVYGAALLISERSSISETVSLRSQYHTVLRSLSKYKIEQYGNPYYKNY